LHLYKLMSIFGSENFSAFPHQLPFQRNFIAKIFFMKNISLLLLGQFIALSVAATTIYEIKYSFSNSTIEYTAFLVRYENQTGFMRVRYTDSKGLEQVVHMDFDELPGTSTDNNINYQTLEFKGKSPVSKLGTDTYDPDLIWFRKSPSETLYYPWGVTSPNANDNYIEGKITSFRLLNTVDITRSYANQFFGTSETFFVNLFGSTAGVTHAGSLKLLMIGNTEDVDIGASCKKDIARVKKTFGDIADFLGLHFDYTEVSGSTLNKNSIVSAINAMQSTTSDIVVICYSGHGFHYPNDNDAYPYFDLRTSAAQQPDANSVSFSGIYKMLAGKTARFKMLLADCCNSYITISKPYGPPGAGTRQSRVEWSKSNCENLFMQSNGIIAASASSIGEVALGNDMMGGYFLFNFVESLDKALSVFQGNISWSTVLAETRSAVLAMTTGRTCNTTICTQTPVSYVQLN
jgi:hypothetical protein